MIRQNRRPGTINTHKRQPHNDASEENQTGREGLADCSRQGRVSRKQQDVA
jgi:hypothetical protein